MMATKIYETEVITLVDGKRVRLYPLKLRYLREFMDQFSAIKKASTDYEAIAELSKCAAIAMRQFCPELETLEDFEDSVDLEAIYTILRVSAGIKINPEEETEVKEQAESSGSTWEDLDLAKIEAEVFLLGIWKDYEELESSMSMPEILSTLGSKRELDFEEKKFLASIQGIDISGEDKEPEVDAWEAMKARVFSGGQTGDPNDIIAYQGHTANKAGFGIGMGLDYEDNRK
jgi:hypothetical protein